MAPKKKEAEPAGDAGDLKASMETELVIAVLKSRLGRYQEAGEKLAVEGYKLTDELAKQKLTLQDINEFLTNELKARSVATTQLEERVVELTAKMQEVQREAQAAAARVKAEAAADVEAATSRVAELTSQLEGSSEFLQQREAMESQLTQLRATLAAKTKEVEQKLSDLERRHLQDKERARHEMVNKIRETKIAMAQLADQHLEGSTKRTLAENEAMAAQLAYHEAASARLVEANNALRADIGELRRELGVAHKTVESTARKNLLLQQTIKAILCCLQQEGATAEAAATAASAVSGSNRAAVTLSGGHAPSSSGGCYGETGEVLQLQQCLSFALQSDTPAGATGATPCAVELNSQQRQTADEQVGISVACTGDNLHSSPLPEQVCEQCDLAIVTEEQQVSSWIDHQHQDAVAEVATASSSVTHNVVLQLEQQVFQLSDDLAAAKQALAAALQGLLPEGCAAKVVVRHDSNSASDTPQQQHGGSRGLSSKAAAAAQSCGFGSTEPRAQLEGRGGRQSPNATVRSSMVSPSHAAFTDRGATPQQQQQLVLQPGSPSSPGGWVRSRNIDARASSRSGIGRSRSSSPASPKHNVLSKGFPGPAGKGAGELGLQGALCAAGGMSAALDDGVAAFVLHCIQQLRYSGDIARQQPGCGSLSPSACSSPVGRGAQRHSSVAAVTSLPVALDSEAAAREHLARLLLWQLHGYARYKVAAFQGLGLELPGVAPSSSAAARLASADAAAEAAAAAEHSRATSNPNADRFSHCNCADGFPNVWLPQGGGEQQQAQPVLPPLPTLLGMGPVSPAGTTSRMTPNSVAAGCNHVSSGVRSSTEDLFSAVLSDVRPWGSSSIAARRPSVSLAQQQQQCSPTSMVPAGVHMQQQQQQQYSSPKLPCAGMQNHGAAASNKGFCSSGTSAGRLARAAEAAAVTGLGGLSEVLGEQLRSRPAGASPVPP